MSFIKSNVVKQVLESLGELSINFVFLERMIQSTISISTSMQLNLINRLVGSDNFDALLSKFNNTVIYCLDSVKLLNDELLNELKLITKKLYKVNVGRNKMLHSLIYTDEQGNLKRYKFNKKVKKDKKFFDVEIINEQTLIELNKDITDSIIELDRFKQKIKKLISL